MKKLMVIILVVTLVTMFSGIALAGHGAPSGPHYNLNIIGVPKPKKNAVMENQGHRIFVKLWGTSKILLQNGGEDLGSFQVIDANATDADGGKFQLPIPYEDEGVMTARYTIYARALGKPMEPGKQTTMVLCYDGWCATGGEVLVRAKGKPTWKNVTKQLLYIDGLGWLFQEGNEGYYWEYDNEGLKLAQLRFYLEEYSW